jgi:adenine-specific DNA-methyltransferase
MDLKPMKSGSKRYEMVAKEKADGATYTPKVLANFVAKKIIELFGNFKSKSLIRILDPAIGDGELILSLLEEIPRQYHKKIKVYGFETDQKAINFASARLKQKFPDISINFQLENFLSFVLENFGVGGNGNLFQSEVPLPYDIIIANPPYVRTQILGFSQAQILTQQFGLSGRVDLYYAFIFAMAWVLKPNGTAGIIVSNRFMTTKSGRPVRKALHELFNINHIWDLGDTKIFEAAVLPSVLLVEGRNGKKLKTPDFTTIYQTNKDGSMSASNPIEVLSCKEGIVKVEDGRNFIIQHGKLDTGGEIDGVWRVETKSNKAWLATVEANTWGTFADIGKIRVGVKTCADKIFIRSDWQEMPENERPELLRPLTTHHNAQRFKAKKSVKTRQILYPHEASSGQRQVIKLSKYPRTKTYLNSHRSILEGRKYVVEAGRKWYEIWVPQDPTAWDKPKMVFRDITKEPTFWIDKEGSIINGDCYWLICQDESQTDLLWLATAIGNSTFIEKYYDCRFNNKLYAGRRRFITQYVEKFPLPDPKAPVALAIIKKAKRVYKCISSQEADRIQKEIDALVHQVFGLTFKEV